MTLRRAICIGLLALPILALLVNHCGSVHNSQCGIVLTATAYLALLPTAFVYRIFGLQGTAVNDYLFLALFSLVTFAWLTSIIYGVSLALSVRSRRGA